MAALGHINFVGRGYTYTPLIPLKEGGIIEGSPLRGNNRISPLKEGIARSRATGEINIDEALARDDQT
jgi:hypothetical protein